MVSTEQTQSDHADECSSEVRVVTDRRKPPEDGGGDRHDRQDNRQHDVGHAERQLLLPGERDVM